MGRRTKERFWTTILILLAVMIIGFIALQQARAANTWYKPLKVYVDGEYVTRYTEQLHIEQVSNCFAVSGKGGRSEMVCGNVLTVRTK